MNKIPLLEYVVIFLGAIAMYTPWLQLSKSQRVTGKELGQQYPEYGWIRWGFVIPYLLWAVIMFYIFFNLLLRVNSVSLIGVLFASIGLFIGSFAVITNVCLLPTRSPRFIFIVGDEAHKAGRFQVLWSLTVIILGITLVVLT